MNKRKIAVIVAWTVLLVSLVGVQQGYAKIGVPIPAPPVSLSGRALNLNGSYEAVEISPYCPLMYPQHVCTCILNSIFTAGSLSCNKTVGVRVASDRLPG